MRVLEWSEEFGCNPVVGVFTPDCVTILKDYTKALSHDQWKELLLQIDVHEFWGTEERINDDGILDGSTWVLTGSKIDWPLYYEGDKRVTRKASRRSPQDYTGIYQIGTFILELSGEDWGEIY